MSVINWLGRASLFTFPRHTRNEALRPTRSGTLPTLRLDGPTSGRSPAAVLRRKTIQPNNISLGPGRALMAEKQSNGHLRNRLLAAIPPNAFLLFEAGLRTSTFKQGTIVQEVGEPVEQIYFPQTGMISLIVVTQEGGGIEAAMIGREGAVGLHRGLGKRRAFTRAVIQVSGTISHISADVFERAVGQSDAIKDIIMRYTEVLWVEAQQIAACNAVHGAEARLARWLLQTQDRIDFGLASSDPRVSVPDARNTPNNRHPRRPVASTGRAHQVQARPDSHPRSGRARRSCLRVLPDHPA